jgi:hypothetical protein
LAFLLEARTKAETPATVLTVELPGITVTGKAIERPPDIVGRDRDQRFWPQGIYYVGRKCLGITKSALLRPLPLFGNAWFKPAFGLSGFLCLEKSESKAIRLPCRRIQSLPGVV